MAALTGVAPVSLGLKDRDPELLDDKAEWSADERDVRNKFPAAALLDTHKNKNTRPASPFNALRRTARSCRTALRRSCDCKKEHTPSSLSADDVCRFGRPQDLHADVGLIDWAQR